MPPSGANVHDPPAPMLTHYKRSLLTLKNVAFRFTEWMKSQSASVSTSGSKRVKRAALFTSPSNLPIRVRTSLKHASNLVDALEIRAKDLSAASAFLRYVASLICRSVVMNQHASAFASQAQSDSPPDALG